MIKITIVKLTLNNFDYYFKIGHSKSITLTITIENLDLQNQLVKWSPFINTNGHISYLIQTSQQKHHYTINIKNIYFSSSNKCTISTSNHKSQNILKKK
jgi:hypothetical protein